MNEWKYHKTEFDFEVVLDPDDYLYFYSEALTVERTKKGNRIPDKRIKC
mgnify:CR=1 FL=1